MSSNPTESFLNSMSPQELVAGFAQTHGVDPDLATRMMTQESGGRQGAVSLKGARGIMQLMPGTAKQLGVDPNDPIQNIQGGIRYLKQQLNTFGGDPRLAAAAYNAGPGAVQKYGGVPPYRETQNYVARVAGQQVKSPANATEKFLQSLAPAANPTEAFLQKQTAPQAAPQAPTFHPVSPTFPGGGYTTGPAPKIARQPSPAETQLAQLWQNAHDAGDPDAMRSLGRELQQKFGWEYGETTPGWPYIKPPANFQAAPGVDATASLRATQVPTIAVSGRGANPYYRWAGDLPYNAAAALKTVGSTLAGIPKAVGDVLGGPSDIINQLVRNPNDPRATVMPQTGQIIESAPASQAISGAGEKLQSTAQEQMAKAQPGLATELTQGAFGMAPLAALPGGVPALMAQQYAQRRGEGGTPSQAALSAGAMGAGIKGGGALGKLGERYLGKYLADVLGTTISMETTGEIANAIETGKLPDPRQVGVDAFKNAVFAAGFSALGGRKGKGRVEVPTAAPERPQAQPEPPSGTVGPNDFVEGYAREDETARIERGKFTPEQRAESQALTEELLAKSRQGPGPAPPVGLSGTGRGKGTENVPLMPVSELVKSGEIPAKTEYTAQPSHADTMAQGSVNSLSEARNIAFRAENGRDPTPDETANFTHDQTLAARQVQHDAINQSIADPNVKRIKIIAGSPGDGKSTYIEAQPADSHDSTVYYETHFEDPNEIKRVITEAKRAGKDVEVVGVLRGGGPIESYKKVVERADETGKIVSPEYGADLTKSFYGNLPDIANYAREQGVPVRATQLEGDQTRTLTGKIKMPELSADLEDQYRGLAKESKYADQFLSQGRPGGAGGLEPGPRAIGQEPQPLQAARPQGTEAIPQTPGQGTQEAPQSTGIKHAVVEAERTARGAADIEKLSTSMPETFDKGKAIVDDDPSGWRGKVGQWAEKPTAHSPEEQAALEYDRARLGNERRTAEAAVDGATDPQSKAAAQEKLNQIIQHIDNNDQVAIDTGTLWGQQGNVRQQMMKDDYSLTNLERQYKAKGIEVTPDLHKQLADMSAKISDAIDRVNKLAASKQEWAARAAKPRSEKLTSWKVNLKQGADEAMAELKRLGVIERGSGLSTDQLKLAAKWGAYKLAEKGLTLAEWTDHMVQTFGETIREQLPALRQAAYAEYKRAKDDAAWNQSQTPEGKQSALQDIRREILEGQAQERAANRAKTQAERLEKQSTIGAAKIQAGIAKEDAAQVAAQQAAEARQRVRDAKERQAQIERLEKQKIAEAAAPRARAQARQTQLQEQLDTGNVEPKPRQKFTPDRETQLAQLEVSRLKRQVDQKRLALEEANKTPAEKFGRGVIKLNRSLIVSGTPTLAHVAMQNVWRPLTWLQEDIAGITSKAAMPGVARSAPSEGRGIGVNLSSTAKGIAKTIRTAIDVPQWGRILKTGQTDLDAQLGRPAAPPSALELFGRLHNFLRAPIQAGAYERALARRLSVATDPNDPIELAPAMVGAYADAQRENLMQPAKVTEKMMSALGPIAKIYQPVVRIGTNFATETLRGTFGIPEAIGRRLWQGAFPETPEDLKAYADKYTKGDVGKAQTNIENQAEAIMRALKKGSVGPLLTILGLMNYKSLGGISQTKEEKDKAAMLAPKAGEVHTPIGNIPAFIVRAPGWTQVQLGATLGKLLDEYQSEGRSAGEAAEEAGSRFAKATVGNIPTVRMGKDVNDAMKAEGLKAKAGQLVARTIVPPDVQKIAKTGIPFTGGKLGDIGPTGEPVDRSVKGFTGNVQAAIPIARRGLPERSLNVGNVKVDLPPPIQSITFAPGERKQFLSAQIRSTVTRARDAELKDAYGQLVNRPEYPALTTEQKQAAIKATMTAIDHGYMSKVKLRMKPNHDLADKWTDEADYDVGDIVDKAIEHAQEKQAVNQ